MPFGQALTTGLTPKFGNSLLGQQSSLVSGSFGGAAGAALPGVFASGGGIGGTLGGTLGGAITSGLGLLSQFLLGKKALRAEERALERLTLPTAAGAPGGFGSFLPSTGGLPGTFDDLVFPGPALPAPVTALQQRPGGAAMLPTFMLTPRGRPRQGPIGVINPVTGECTFVANLGAPTGFKNWSRRRSRRRPR